jgi:predicted RNase H-like HicB family nuclease
MFEGWLFGWRAWNSWQQSSCRGNLPQWIGGIMETARFIYYREEDMFVGWLEEYPHYRTQGATIEVLEANLKDLFQELNSGAIPCVRRMGELRVA